MWTKKRILEEHLKIKELTEINSKDMEYCLVGWKFLMAMVLLGNIPEEDLEFNAKAMIVLEQRIVELGGTVIPAKSVSA